MAFTLSISTNPLVNRFAEPEELMAVIAGEIGIGHVQLTHEFLNPSWPAETLAPLVARMAAAASAHGVAITSMMTGPYGRLNHFGHPDAGVRAYYLDWFKTLADISADLGCPAIGTQFAILTYRDFDDRDRREMRLRDALDCWARLAEHAGGRGLTWMFWEPMSVGREFGHTLQECTALQRRIDAAGLSLPLRPMIDIDHGDVTSADPADTDPYAWAKRFAAISPIIHIKQSSMNKGGHWPFTATYNENGRITPDKLLAHIRAGSGADNELCLELAFRERDPTDRQVVDALAESVKFWSLHTHVGQPKTG
ncbi:sugar phosphate isomerase/epimerase family protein [Aurantimonas coralicida]|uniref:sugar phosphate isomerase/epimerase family protein n=1 Tax=Aurantimonas coralicida TaxID=182270 RepID=UPI001E2EFB64|nr:TIM barrel protein [Aurantimonas coralicida]MCD1645566.1 sugar phosphate isomerase/epimerase [Aurantimonas coralicida]